jgi:hypothetical protein
MANVTIRTAEREAIILEALRTRPTYRYATRRAKISRNAFHQWRLDDPEFAANVAEARRAGMGEVEDQLIDDALHGNTTAQIFLLKSHFRDVYGDRVDHLHSGLITFAADWVLVRAAIFAALAHHPEALADVSARLDAIDALEAGEPSDE